MKNQNNIQKQQEDNNIIKNIINNQNIQTEIKNCEYVYIDKIELQYINNPIFNDKILLTKKMNNYYMLENTNNKTKQEMTKLNYKHIVDLLILSQTTQKNTDIQNIIDQDTIIIKNLGHNIIYLEDQRKQIKSIITPYEKIILIHDGINTQMKYYEILN